MTFMSISLMLAAVRIAVGADPDYERVMNLLDRENCIVSWGTVPTFSTKSELLIGEGSGHAQTLEWLRFKPETEGVDVLDVELDMGRKPYRSKWPPDRATVATRRARMTDQAYASLLRDLAVVASAKLTPRGTGSTISSHDFWMAARVADGRATRLDLDWAGYWSSRAEYLLGPAWLTLPRFTARSGEKGLSRPYRGSIGQAGPSIRKAVQRPHFGARGSQRP